jgi:hypothetical protein
VLKCMADLSAVSLRSLARGDAATMTSAWWMNCGAARTSVCAGACRWPLGTSHEASRRPMAPLCRFQNTRFRALTRGSQWTVSIDGKKVNGHSAFVLDGSDRAARCQND